MNSNNGSTLAVDNLTSENNRPGLLVRNLGEFVNEAEPSQMSTSGFEISANKITFDKINMSYNMQGGLLGNWCGFTNSNNFVYLNGPGVNGGTTGAYLSPQTVGFNYYQGSYFQKSQNPVSVASYENNAVTSTDIFAFSGSGTDRTQMYACNIHPGIPKVNGVAKPSTFFSKLLIADTQSKHCRIPSNALTSGYEVNCGTNNTDSLYKLKQCIFSCATGFVKIQNELGQCANDGDDFILSGCINNSSQQALEFYEPFSNNDDYLSRFNPTQDRNGHNSWGLISYDLSKENITVNFGVYDPNTWYKFT